MSIQRDALADIMDALFRVGREAEQQREALRLTGDEFKLLASFKGFAFATTRHRSRRLVHVADRAFTVWRPDGDSHRLVRVVALAFCGQWILAARRADWNADDESRCDDCLAVARKLVAKQAEEELAAAAAEADRTTAAVQTFVDAGLVDQGAALEVDF